MAICERLADCVRTSAERSPQGASPVSYGPTSPEGPGDLLGQLTRLTSSAYDVSRNARLTWLSPTARTCVARPSAAGTVRTTDASHSRVLARRPGSASARECGTTA